jgi:uncharacterized protein
MTETPFFFRRDGARLFGLLHSPSEPVSRTGFVLSHPFAEEKLWSHRVFVSLARALAARGHPVLRFDYTGAGDSSGTSLDVSLDTHLADLATAVDRVARDCPYLERVGIVGLRLGATVAALLSERVASGDAPTALHAAPLVLWDPVLDGAAYLQELMRSNLSSQLATFGKVIDTREVLQQRVLAGGTVNVDGYELGDSVFRSLGRSDLLTSAQKRHAGPTLVVSIAPPGKARARPDLVALAAAYREGGLVAAEEQPFWREIKSFYGRAELLQALTLDWLGAADA